MSILSRVIGELSKPDDQGDDWYGWASNQLSHAFIGLVLAVHFGLLASVAVACVKEIADIIRKPTNVVDSITDVAFWSLGALLVYAEDKVLVTIVIVFALVCGLIPRIRKLTGVTD